MVIWLVSIAVAVALHGARILALYENAGQDSFHTLSAQGQTGLVLISGLLVMLMLLLVATVNRRFLALWRGVKPESVVALLIKLGASLFLFAALITIAPQAYYLYYLALFPDLPVQWVIRPGQSAVVVLEVLTFTGNPSYAAVFTGVTGWTIIIGILLGHVLHGAGTNHRWPGPRTNQTRTR